MIDLKDLDWWKTVADYLRSASPYLFGLWAFFSFVLNKTIENVRMIWKTVKSSRRYGQSCWYFSFFFSLSCLL
ncbi:hypothetical protein AP064_03545 [Candidatus Liberibacter solanacearum]|uniref:hypothetical protein n=1 Tax=Candidatus Liberibacter solanacearum TaxID=556287 RepID=UPI0005FA3D73|nr:hypothetical protein [Candidatus Liberibacter solanacearum]KJZ81272.1 hypothetical protein KP07_01130 [Candidatus Liberibacter solanacearum]KQC49138.1 hypothetical protein AP064_03545 [Candidatus Liberibacter solanacearum]